MGRLGGLLAVDEGLDVEAERGADAHDVLAVELLQDRRLPGVVEPAGTRAGVSVRVARAQMACVRAYRKRMRISFSFCLFFLIIVSRPIFALQCSYAVRMITDRPYRGASAGLAEADRECASWPIARLQD